MSIFFPEPDIKVGEVGFDGKCQLGRAASGKKLSELVEKISEPVVIAVDGPWGSGKSHFLKLWKGAHTLENEGTAKVIYFDAFKHDYFDDPLVALMGELSEAFDPEGKNTGPIKALWNKTEWLRKPLLRGGLALATAGGTEIAGAVVDAGINAVSKEMAGAIDTMGTAERSRRDAMEGFKTDLKDLTIKKDSEVKPQKESSSKVKPQKIVIIIDELDRCRPDFALNMLETIKHFFAVENVIFVLGVNLGELENSVKARYGTGINAGKYLQKFIHVRFVIEDKSTYSGRADVALNYFEQIAAQGVLQSESYKEYLHLYLRNLEPAMRPNLREIQRLVTSAVIAPNNYRLDPDIYLISGLLVMSVTAPETIGEAKAGTLRFDKVERLLSLTSGKPTNDPQFCSDARDIWRICLDKDFTYTLERLGQLGYTQGQVDRPREIVPRVADFLFGAIDVTRFE